MKTSNILVIPHMTEQLAALGFTHRVRITHENLTEAAANTDQVIPLLAVKAGQFVDRAAMVLVTPFQDASDEAFNDTKILVGDGGDTDRFLRSNTAATGLQINENGAEVLQFINPVAAANNGLDSAPYMYQADDTVDLTVGSMADKSLADLDTGVLDIYLRVVDLAEQSRH